MTCNYHDATAVCDRCPDEFDTDGKGFPHPAVRKGRQALRVCAYCNNATAIEQWDVAQYHRCLDCAKAASCQVFAVARETVDAVARRQVDAEVAERRRSCTVCLNRGKQVDATHVARAEDGLEWFECGQHEPTENEVEFVRVSLTPIAEWFGRNGLPVPGRE